MAIHVFPRRLEIWNSGALPDGVTEESLAKGQISVLRNPDIAHALYLRGFMEKAGRGSVLMIQQCLENDLVAPEWKSDEVLGVTVTFRPPESTPQATPQAAPHVTPQVKKLLSVLKGEMDRDALQTALGLKARKNFRLLYLAPALYEGLIEMTIPDKPQSSNQKYRLTDKGRAFLKEC